MRSPFSALLRRTSAAPTAMAGATAMLTLLGTVLAGCESQDLPTEETGGVATQVAALATCGGQVADPFAALKTLKLVVREPGANGLVVAGSSPTAAYSTGKSSLVFSDIKAGSPFEVTLMGFGSGGGTAQWFGRRTGVNIKKNDTTTLDMALMAVENFTCVGTKNMANALFSSSAVMDNGRVLITGGFTNATPDGGLVRLESPSDAAYIFDPNTGAFARAKGLMKEARAGHSMIYLPKLNQVLIVGGAKKMTIAADGSAPPMWSVTDGTSLSYEVYDVASDTFLAGADNGLYAKKRVFPNLIALTDDYVVSLGGAPWPISNSDDYAKSDLFNSTRTQGQKTGKFVDSMNTLQLNAVRAGSSVAYIGPTSNGTNRYLIWGGTTIDQGYDPGNQLTTAIKHAERFKESTEPGTGEFSSDYKLEGDFPTDFPLFFPTLTRIGKTTEKSGEYYHFLSIGGVRYDPKTKTWLAPKADDVFRISLKEATESTKGRILTTRVPGLSKGVYFHQSNLAGTGHVVTSGGFSAHAQPVSQTMQAFTLPSVGPFYVDDTKLTVDKAKLPAVVALPAAKSFVMRGGHSGLTLRNDCVLMFGGTSVLGTGGLSSTQAATADIYCPKFLLPN